MYASILRGEPTTSRAGAAIEGTKSTQKVMIARIQFIVVVTRKKSGF